MALTAYTLVTTYARQITTKAMSTPTNVIQTGHRQNYTSGTANYQVSIIYTRTGTLAPGSTLTLNLKDGSLLDGLGNPLQFTVIKFFHVHNLSTKASAYLSIATFGAVSTGHFHFRFSGGTLYCSQLGDVFMSAPKSGGILATWGTWVKLRAYSSNTVCYNLVIAGEN